MSDGADDRDRGQDRDRDRDRGRMPHPSERDPEAEVNGWPGRARRVGTDREGDGIDRSVSRGRTRSEWEADGGRAQDRERDRIRSPFRRQDESADNE